MNNSLGFAPKLLGSPRFYAPPRFALLTSGQLQSDLQKRTIVLFHYNSRFEHTRGAYPKRADYCAEGGAARNCKTPSSKALKRKASRSRT